MLKVALPFKTLLWSFVVVALTFPGTGMAESAKFKKHETGLYRDLFDQNFYYEGTNFLHLERLYRALFRKKMRSANVNVFDEIADSTFFTNRHGRARLSLREIGQGYRETEGPSSNGELSVVRGKFEGLHPGFFVRDKEGEEYLLKFDPLDNFELATAAEVIASRFYHAIGYNVPQYTIYVFDASRLVPAPEAMTLDDTGFTKKLTPEKLEEYLLFLPQDPRGDYRASASKLLPGKNLGYLDFVGRRSNDPEDPFDHKDRREIRALQVFSSWLNNYDVRESNSMDRLVEENGRQVIKHYLIDFNTALGASRSGPKEPMITHENVFDYGEFIKAFLGLGLWTKPWQKRWYEAGEKPHSSPAVGYFDNRYFDPGKYKTQLPYFALKDLTRADGFWAAKIIMAFTDEEIRTIVKAGEYTDPQDTEYVAQVLIERRDKIGRYWFEKANPLDRLDIKGDRLVFEDLAVKYGFSSGSGTVYHLDVIQKEGKRGEILESIESLEPSINLGRWLSQSDTLDLLIRSDREGADQLSPFVLVEIRGGRIAGIFHED